MGDQPAEDLYELRTTSTVRRALGEALPEAVAAAAYNFITGPLLRGPYRVGKKLLPPMGDRFSARRGTYRIIYGSMTRIG
jgi:mRNA interferase RelE/StbE